MSRQPHEESFEGAAEHEPAQPDVAAQEYDRQLNAKFLNGANWFFWIAALSVVNAVISLLEGDRHFVIGLGFTNIVNAVAVLAAKESPAAGVFIKAIAITVSCLAGAVVATLGFGARRRLEWVFILGMILYALDGLICLFITDFLSFAFHLFALWSIFGGLRACRQLMTAELYINDIPDAEPA